MFDGAKMVFSAASAIAATLIILWLIGIATVKGTHGMAAVGAGISTIFRTIEELFGSIHF